MCDTWTTQQGGGADNVQAPVIRGEWVLLTRAGPIASNAAAVSAARVRGVMREVNCPVVRGTRIARGSDVDGRCCFAMAVQQTAKRVLNIFKLVYILLSDRGKTCLSR